MARSRPLDVAPPRATRLARAVARPSESSQSRRRPSAWGWLVTVSALPGRGRRARARRVVAGHGRDERRLLRRARLGQRDHAGSRARPTLEIVGGGDRAGARGPPHRPVLLRPPGGGPARRRRRRAAAALALPAHGAGGVLGRATGCACPTTCRSRSGRPPATCASAATAARRSVDTGTGDIASAGCCGFKLQVRAEAGRRPAGASCAPERLQLRSRAGDVRALVPRRPLPRRRRHRRGQPQRPRRDRWPRTRRSRSRRSPRAGDVARGGGP